jgi:hypothetical protein
MYSFGCDLWNAAQNMDHIKFTTRQQFGQDGLHYQHFVLLRKRSIIGFAMNEFYQTKFNELFMEFTRYLIEHPEFAERIPEGAQVVLLDRHDPLYSQQAIELANRARETDDVPDRPVVYMEVAEMAPVRSRLLPE